MVIRLCIFMHVYYYAWLLGYALVHRSVMTTPLNQYQLQSSSRDMPVHDSTAALHQKSTPTAWHW